MMWWQIFAPSWNGNALVIKADGKKAQVTTDASGTRPSQKWLSTYYHIKEQGMYILTERFNQDPVKIYFGQQRDRGHCNDNPSVTPFMLNTQGIILQKSLALG